MFDPEIQTTVLSGELISKRMINRNEQQKEALDENHELDENEYEDADD